MTNRTKQIYCLIFIFFCYQICWSQFSKAIDRNSNSGIVHINSENEILHGVYGTNSNRVITKFDINGNILWSKELLPVSYTHLTLPTILLV